MTSDNSRHRLGLLAVTALSLFGALFARLWFLQVVEASTLEERVSSNATREVIIPAPRGRILDANNLVLVDNRESTVVAIDWQEYRDLEEQEQRTLLERLAGALNRTVDEDDSDASGDGSGEGSADGSRSTDGSADGDSGDGADGGGGEEGGGEEGGAAAPATEEVTVRFLERRLNDTRFNHFRPIPVAEDIPVELEIYFKEQADLFPAVHVERQTVRAYPYGSLAAHVLGYVGSLSEQQWAALKEENDPDKPYEQADEIGKSGVEARYEQYLRGTPGRRVYEVDRAGRVVREVTSERVEPKAGDDVHLSIDARIQYRTEEALQARVVAADAPAGAAVVVDPRNGQVRAMASYPTYDPADLVGGISQDLWAELNDPETKIMSNRAIQEAYPAASTFKLASSYAGLKLGIITPDGPVVDSGTLQLCSPPRTDSGCLKRNSGGGKAMGTITLHTALTRSSDVYFYKLGVEAWRRHQDGSAPEDALQQEIMALGYGARTGVDLTGESPGRVPTPESNRNLADSLWEASRENYDNDEEAWQDARRWKAGYNADIAIGQFDTLVTPLQTANAYAALANGEGRLYRPSVLSHVARANSATVVHPFEAELIRTIDWGGWREALLEGFAGVTQSEAGTAFSVFRGFPMGEWAVAGKTGTAEVGDDAAQRRDNSLFVGYGPTADPEFVASVMIEGGGFGAQAAAPAVRMILEPIALGEILPEGRGSFQVPRGGGIDAERAAEESAAIGTSGAD